MRQVPIADVTGHIGRRSSFEVTINERLVFSKLKERDFPNFSEMVDEVVAVKKSQDEAAAEAAKNLETVKEEEKQPTPTVKPNTASDANRHVDDSPLCIIL